MPTDSTEVLALPDNPGNGKVGSDIIQRMSNRRKVRHEQAVQDMHNKLAAIAKELETKVQEVGHQLKIDISASRSSTGNLLAKLSDDEILMAHSLGGLHQIWAKVEASTNGERDLVRNFEKILRHVEVDRCDKVTELFQMCREQLESIAFLLQPDVDEFVAREAEVVSEAVQNNHRTLTMLCGRLHVECIEKELVHHNVYAKLEERWKMLHSDRIFADFEQFMNSDEVTQPDQVSKVMDSLHNDQEAIITKASDHLRSLSALEPPACTKSAVRLWNREMQSLLAKLDTVHQQSLAALQESQVAATDSCVIKMENLQACLVNEGYCSEDEVIELMNKKYLPHVERRQEEADQMIRVMEATLKYVMTTLRNQAKETFDLALGAGNLWDCHQAQVQVNYRTWQEEHDDLRKAHLGTIQQAEAKLSETMTVLREGHSKQVLDQYLASAGEQLSNLWGCYESFCEQGCALATTYSMPVETEVFRYDKAIFVYFEALKNLPEPPPGLKKPSKSRGMGGRTSRMHVGGRETSMGGKSTGEQSQSNTTAGRAPLRGKKHLGTEPVASGRQSTLLMLDPNSYEQLHLPCGTTVYIIPKPDADRGTNVKVFLTETDESEEAAGAVSERYADQLVMFAEAAQSARERVRINCLNHACTYQEKAMAAAQVVVADKVEEYETEISLKKTVHGPRLARIKRDIHNVRAAEVVQHEQRVQCHISTIFETVTVQQQRLRALKSHAQNETEEFSHHLSELTAMLSASSSLSMLASVEKKAQESLDKHVANVKSEVDTLYCSVEEVFNNLKRATDDLRNSFKLFADGGNFCYEEVQHLNADLESLDVKVMSAEHLLLHDLTNLEQSLCTQGNDILARFQESYVLHEADMAFLEKVSQLLTRVQICIKTEVGSSNQQTADLVGVLKEVEEYCHRLERAPERSVAASCLQRLGDLAELCRTRADYLDCLADNVETVRCKDGDEKSEPISAINVTRKILRHQANAMPKSGALALPRLSKRNHSRKGGSGSKLQDARSIITSDTERSKFRFGRRKARTEDTQLNRKSFLPRVHNIIKQGKDGIESVCQAYYISKGNRAPLWTDSMAATFEGSCDSAGVKLQSYCQQAEEYHNSCLLEFHSLLQDIVQCACRLVPLVMKSTIAKNRQMLTQKLSKLVAYHNEQCEQLDDAKKANHKQLEPSLSHPTRLRELEALDKIESERQTAAGALYKKWLAVLQNGTRECCTTLMKLLVSSTSSVLMVLDGLLMPGDIVTGKLPPVHKTVIQMLREQQNPAFNEKEDSSESTTVKVTSWPSLGVDDLLRQWCPDCCNELSKKIVCNQVTPAHEAALQSRDDLFQIVLEELHSAAEKAKHDTCERTKSLQRWSKYWKDAVLQISKLQ